MEEHTLDGQVRVVEPMGTPIVARPDRTSVGDVLQWRITVTPRAEGDWHLSIVTYEWWTGAVLANFDSRIDTLNGCVEAIEANWEEQHRDRDESRSEARDPSA